MHTYIEKTGIQLSDSEKDRSKNIVQSRLVKEKAKRRNWDLMSAFNFYNKNSGIKN